MKDYIVTILVPFELRVENQPDADAARAAAWDTWGDQVQLLASWLAAKGGSK